MPAETLRTKLTAAVKDALPAGWRFIPNQKTPEKITRVTVTLKHLRIKPLPEAPAAAFTNSVVLTIASPLTDDVKAENALDEDVLTLLHTIAANTAGWMQLDEAEKVRVRDGAPYLGWDCKFDAITTKA
ncbi:hypothetical protein ASE14_08125 [Agromyces sp. Root81]|uniref:hypothetical protein n=1 Tax=Agromyces sp. Root81 TaxID=1736601 RepID=UPI0006F4886F|nr:hypothetical protein [Agromyces sp. Root81]KRC60917.1 hypothetical protein ASE14_08125 [Agromyces sp. Root81]